MSGSRVRALTPYKTLREFFQYMYGERDGYVYAPTKDPSKPVGENWQQNWFRWPAQERELIHHFQQETTLELYYSPALWSANRISPDTFLGVQCVWAEMDYGILQSDALEHRKIPAPSMRIQSSTEDHQHWYWRLSYFESDPRGLETITKRLAYAVEADLSCWDYQQVLRPPTTIHQESGLQVKILEKTITEYGAIDFVELPDPPTGSEVVQELGELPDVTDVIAAYKWKPTSFKIFRQQSAEVHKRSDTLCYLAYECAEMGMKDSEIMAILLNADDRWGKFKKRNDRVKHLRGIILRARHKYPVVDDEELEDDFPVFGFNSFLEHTEFQVRWLVEGLIPAETINMVAARPGIGKSQFTLQLCIALALGRPFLDWEITEPQKAMFFSMDMGRGELHEFMEQMAEEFSPTERRQLEKNFQVIPWGEAVVLNRASNQAKVKRLLGKYQPSFLAIDNLGVAVGDDLGSDKVINPVMDFLKSGIIKEFGSTVWLIHHSRKPQVGNKKPNTIYDIYGNQFITNHLSTAVGLWKDKESQPWLEVISLKARLMPEWEPFAAMRTSTLGFERLDKIPEKNEPVKGDKKNASDPNRSGISI